MTQKRQRKILLIEDDPADQKIINSALLEHNNLKEVQIISTAEDALKNLEQEYASSESPALILLDLKMPGMGGKELLNRIKKNEQLKQIPVIILTTSDSKNDIQECYKRQAAGYILKQTRLVDLKARLSTLIHYWFDLCKLP